MTSKSIHAGGGGHPGLASPDPTTEASKPRPSCCIPSPRPICATTSLGSPELRISEKNAHKGTVFLESPFLPSSASHQVICHRQTTTLPSPQTASCAIDLPPCYPTPARVCLAFRVHHLPYLMAVTLSPAMSNSWQPCPSWTTAASSSHLPPAHTAQYTAKGAPSSLPARIPTLGRNETLRRPLHQHVQPGRNPMASTRTSSLLSPFPGFLPPYPSAPHPSALSLTHPGQVNPELSKRSVLPPWEAG